MNDIEILRKLNGVYAPKRSEIISIRVFLGIMILCWVGLTFAYIMTGEMDLRGVMFLVAIGVPIFAFVYFMDDHWCASFSFDGSKVQRLKNNGKVKWEIDIDDIKTVKIDKRGQTFYWEMITSDKKVYAVRQVPDLYKATEEIIKNT